MGTHTWPLQIADPGHFQVDDLDASERGAGGFGSTGIQGKPHSPPIVPQSAEPEKTE